MKIAGVGVNEKSLPSKDKLISQALKTKAYYQMSRSKAIPLINAEIKASGLFKTSTKRVKKSDSDTSGPSKLLHKTKRTRDKGSD